MSTTLSLTSLRIAVPNAHTRVTHCWYGYSMGSMGIAGPGDIYHFVEYWTLVRGNLLCWRTSGFKNENWATWNTWGFTINAVYWLLNWMADMNSESKLRFDTDTKSRIDLTVNVKWPHVSQAFPLPDIFSSLSCIWFLVGMMSCFPCPSKIHNRLNHDDQWKRIISG